MAAAHDTQTRCSSARVAIKSHCATWTLEAVRQIDNNMRIDHEPEVRLHARADRGSAARVSLEQKEPGSQCGVGGHRTRSDMRTIALSSAWQRGASAICRVESWRGVLVALAITRGGGGDLECASSTIRSKVEQEMTKEPARWRRRGHTERLVRSARD